MSSPAGANAVVAVLVKYVPDAQLERGFTGLTLDRSSSVLSELDEYAIEAALQLRESGDLAEAEIVAVSMGPDSASNAIKKALQMGADRGIHINDDALAGSDASATAKVLAAALGTIDQLQLVITGMASTDAETAVVPAQIAARLNFAPALLAAEVSLQVQQVRYRRDTDHRSLRLSAELPVLLSVTDQANEPRYPNFKGIMAAKKKDIAVLTLADVGLAETEVGASGSLSTLTEVSTRGEREAGVIITDDGTGGTQLADFLNSRKLI